MKEVNAVTLGSQLFTAVPNSVSVSNAVKGKQSFDSFLSTSSTTGTNGIKDGTNGTVPAVKGSAAQPSDTVQADTAGTSQAVQDNSVTDTGSSTENAIQADTGNKDISSASEAAGAVNDVIKEAIKDITGLDDKALEEIMAVLGMSFTDLLDIGNLKQFVMYINNTSDVTDLLMDESMMSQLNNLADVIADIDIEAITGMPESDFAQLLENMADENTMAADGNPAGTLQDQADTTVTVEYEEDMPQAHRELSQVITTAEETADGKGEAVKQEAGQADDGRLITGKEAGESNTTGNQDGFKQGMESQTGETLAESGTQAAPERTVHDEVFNNQAGFIQNLAQAAADVQDGAMPQQSNMQTMINIVNQVVEQIKVTMGNDATSMQLQLNPESLGKVLISVTSNHGVMTANFTVQTEEAKEALQSQMFSLREALESRNLKVDAVEVEVSDFAFSQSNQADSQNQKEFEKGNGRRFRFGFEDADEDEGADIAVQGRQNTQKLDMGSSIDFTA